MLMTDRRQQNSVKIILQLKNKYFFKFLKIEKKSYLFSNTRKTSFLRNFSIEDPYWPGSQCKQEVQQDPMLAQARSFTCTQAKRM